MKPQTLALCILVFLSSSLTACGSAAPAEQAAPTATPEPKTFTSPGDADFPVPLSFTYGPEWDVQAGTNSIDLIHKGSPPGPESEWWGVTIAAVDGALVHDPADAALTQPASADKSKFIAWPKDLFGYFSSIPGVKVDGVPNFLNIGGVSGTQMIVRTPAMQPIFWLKDDSTWLGGGSTGLDPAYKRQIILVEVSGKQVMLEFSDSAQKFDEHYPLVRDVYNTLKLGE